MRQPLAKKLRPKCIDDIIGQSHILGEDGILTKMIKASRFPSMIFHGPSGTGKTSAANVIARTTDMDFYKIDATNGSVSDIRDVISKVGGFSSRKGILLYIDEIQNFNKRQQQTLLTFIESGEIVLIAGTTENPYFYIYGAILSRCMVFEFKPLEKQDLMKLGRRATEFISQEINKSVHIEDDAMDFLAEICGGDARRFCNFLESSVFVCENDNSNDIFVTADKVALLRQRQALSYDKSDDNHYDTISAFQKSIRGSDPDAALHYLARLIKGGDLAVVCRRLLVIASEDVGLAYPMAVTVVKSCVDSFLQLGLPEGRIPLAQAVLLLCLAPKSNSAYVAVDAAISDLECRDCGQIPLHLCDKTYRKENCREDYVYPHDFPGHYVEQNYLPHQLQGVSYFSFGENDVEQKFKRYWQKIKSNL